MKFRVGLGYDVHAFANQDSECRLVLGGVTINYIGLVGHSDADAVAHAVCDALLGATGLGDLGSLFPASDERYRDVNSMELLIDVVQRVAATGWTVANVDIVIGAERPRLAAHIDAMVVNLRDALTPLAVDDDGVFVSVQPKRGEGIGSIGRGEGIEVRAVTLLQRQ